MSTEETSLDSKVLEWLSRQGYPLEMSTSRRFRLADWSVRQGEYFTDPHTEKEREIDLIAGLSRSVHETDESIAGIYIEASVECKGDLKKPWVILRGETGRDRPRDEHNTPGNKAGSILLSNLDRIEGLPRSGLLRGPKTCGYGVVVAFKKEASKPDPAYKAMMGLAAAVSRPPTRSEVMMDHLDGFGGESLRRPWIRWRWPLAVIAAPLLEAGLDEEGGLEVRQIDFGRVLWAGASQRRLAIDIATTASLGAVLEVVKSECELVVAACKNEAVLFREESLTTREEFTSRIRERLGRVKPEQESENERDT